MSTDFPKPPLAPKPSLDQVVPLIVCNHPSLALRPSLHQHPNLMSRGPKPPLAPKPVILLTAEGRSSIYINNSLNSCANGEMICYDTCLAAEEHEDVEHQCKCLEFPPGDCILDSLAVKDTGKDNSVGGDGLTQTPVIMTVEDHASSDVAEPVDTGLDESAGSDGRCSPGGLCEVYSSKVHEEDASSQNEDEATDFENDEDKSDNELSFSIREGSQDIDLVKCNNEHNLENVSAFYVEDGLSKNCCDEDVVQLIPLDEETPNIKESNEEVDLPSNLEKGIAYDVPEVCSLDDALSDADADDLLEKESDLLNDDVVDVCVDDNPVDEEADDGLEMPEDAGSHAEMLSDESHNESWSEEVDPLPEKVNADTTNSEIYGNIEQENNVDDGYETIEIKSEEESSEAAHDERECSKDDSAEKDDSLDDSCQIIPFENDCNEDLVDVPHGYLDDFLHLDGGYSFQEAAREAEMKFIIKRNGVSECILEEEYENGEPDSDGQQFGDGKPLSEDKESGDISTEEGDENIDDDVALQDGALTEERDASRFGVNYECKYGSIHCLSLTDEDEENPYVLEHTVHSRGENSLYGERMGLNRSPDTAMSDQSMIGDLSVDIDNNLLSVDRKNIVTRSRSLSGKITGCVPETVPEESGPESDSQFINNDSLVDINTNQLHNLEGKHSEINRLLPAKPRRFIQYPRSYSAEGRDSPLSMYRESNGTSFEHSLFRRKDDNISLPCVLASSGSFSQRSHISSSGVSTPTSGVDIPPPFELATITKKPITKSSPSLLIENESPDKYFKKKKSSFKRFLTLKFRKKTENKIHVDVNVSSSRSSSESSYHGPSRLVEMDRRSLGGSPQLKPHSGKMRACDSPSAVLIYKDGKRKATPKTFSRSVARVESFEDRSRLPFMPLPLTKPRSISFPNADTSDYENIPAMNSDYENIQIPPRRPTRAGTFTEFFEDPSRALASANENDGYVDMSSFTTFEMKQQTPDQGAESAYTEPYKSRPISMLPAEDAVSDEDGRTSADEGSVPGDASLGPKKEGQSRAHIIAEELLTSERVYMERLKLLHTDFYGAILKVLGDEDEEAKEDIKLRVGLSMLPQICDLHQDVLCELEERMQNWEETQKLADVFLSRAASFEHHAAYISQYDRNLAVLDESCLRSHQLASVVREFEQNPDWGRVNVKHQLLRVVERVFQYHMILTDYLNNLCPDSAEYEDTQAALVLVSEVADQANERMRQGENLQKLVHIEHSVRGQSNLLESGREFVKEGTLMKVSGKNRLPRHLFLMNDVLLYTYPQKDGKYRLKNTLSVAGMRVSRPILEKAQNVLRVECMDCCLTLSASSCSECDEWYSCINRTIQDYYKAHSPVSYHNSMEVRERLGICLGDKPPSLVPMSHVMMCMNCSSDFTLTLRRNHCHACGKIVCRNCSKKKYPLRYLNDRPAKVCDSCYAELKKRELPVMVVSFPQPPPSRFTANAFSSVLHSIHPSSFKRQKKIPSALMEAAASGEDSAIRGYLHRCKRGKRHWKKLWFVIKGKVLYTYTASEDKVALESLPLLGFIVLSEKGEGRTDPGTLFQLYHKETLFYSFKAEDHNSAERWIEAMKEATVL
ncbi:FYVE, RhoGEF and PH domain-containing protein 5 isoform X2 [Ambystoma mexicanum]|uniref:FYVE, RhoGEF and PH domain-containing protein 5 isoform X2 n=1 Tax=Ambystoma mexicanum TaxID=8296 RepID=UPI0037E8CE42